MPSLAVPLLVLGPGIAAGRGAHDPFTLDRLRADDPLFSATTFRRSRSRSQHALRRAARATAGGTALSSPRPRRSASSPTSTSPYRSFPPRSWTATSRARPATRSPAHIVASGQRHADPHAHRRRPPRRQGLRASSSAPTTTSPSRSSCTSSSLRLAGPRPPTRAQPAARPRDRRPAPRPVPPRGLPRRAATSPLTRKQFAVLEVLVAAEGGVVSAGGAARAGVGRERRPVHQRRPHHRLGAAQAARPAVDHRHRGRRRLPHRRRRSWPTPHG